MSAEKTERTGHFYAKHTGSSPFQRFSVCGKNLHKSLLFSRKGEKKLLASVSTSASREWLLVEARGVEPRSWRNCPMFSTCLAWAFVFSRRLCAMQTTAGAADLFFLAGGIRLPDAPGQPDVCASSRIRHQGRDVTGYAASAYSVFAVTFLTDDLGGQRSSSACLHRSASSVETISPPDFKEQIPGGRHTLILLNRHLT